MAGSAFHDERKQAELLNKKTELLASFQRGAQLAHELIEENEQLRARLRALEGGDEAPDAPAPRAASALIDQLEQENNSLANLFVAQGQLHRATSVGEVFTVMTEVLLNFVGASTFSIMLVDRDDRLRPISSFGIALDDVPDARIGTGVIGTVARHGRVHVGDLTQADPATDPPVACFPLSDGEGGLVGVVAIWKFLRQKAELVDLDSRLFELIGSCGGVALARARLAAQTGDDPPSTPYDSICSQLD